ncbi:MAG: hypothetical protein COT55_01785 [Candidatus Diapherotrites archaeon CG09_land_8_20_14_0_10_32_12]|nr:MAG: hypothetical protein COT55_01785 [Candidatus Diapherotrites archaeon CG09_land_8_20_14_0_10_32_12]
MFPSLIKSKLSFPFILLSRLSPIADASPYAIYFIVVGISFSRLIFKLEAMPCSKSSNDVELSASIVKEGSP